VFVQRQSLSTKLLLAICVVLTGLLEVRRRGFHFLVNGVAYLLCVWEGVLIFVEELLVVRLQLIGHHHRVLLAMLRLIKV
jgi:hypothetical protein